ncbi:hypothetical protein WA158_005073 [Blastocystis sp. Blastoise]
MLACNNENITWELIDEPVDPSLRKTKIICTLGPATNDVDKIGQLIDAGMNVARFNFSHGTFETHDLMYRNLQMALQKRPGKHVAVMLDDKGPEIRTGYLVDGKPVNIIKDSIVEITTDYSLKGDATHLSCTYMDLPTSVKVGQKIFVADGDLTFIVTEIGEISIKCKAMNSATIGETKNMNLPGVIVTLPTLTEKDKHDISQWPLSHEVDYIAASFVRRGSNIDEIRACLGRRLRNIQIIAKIENEEGLKNIEEILQKADGIMVARGDLGMEMPPEKVFLAQKKIIHLCNVYGKYVITATQMLDSMISKPRPTRAECTDVANAVLDGTDCVMLSGESANGMYPIEAVNIMSRICVTAEQLIEPDYEFNKIRESVLTYQTSMTVPESIASSAVKASIDVNAKLIIVLTSTGSTARQVAKYRPRLPIYVLAESKQTARQISGVIRGTVCRSIESMMSTESIIMRAILNCKQMKMLNTGDIVVAIHGMVEAHSGATNMLRILVCP